jgi:hypothetical protein
MSGSLPFVALRSCGCVFSEAGLKSVVGSVTGTTTPPSEGEDEGGRTVPCPNCNKPFNPAGEKGKSAWLQLNPKAEVQEKLLEDLLAERAAAKLNKQKDKEANGGKKRKSTAANLVDGSNHHDASKRSKTSGSQQPQASTQSHLSSKIQHQLQELEDKRKAGGMSAAVQSIYAGKGGEKKGSNNDFFTRTFTRVSMLCPGFCMKRIPDGLLALALTVCLTPSSVPSVIISFVFDLDSQTALLFFFCTITSYPLYQPCCIDPWKGYTRRPQESL